MVGDTLIPLLVSSIIVQGEHNASFRNIGGFVFVNSLKQ